MGKVELRLEVDETLVRELEARGIDPLRFAEVGFSEAFERAKRWSLVESARRKAKDAEGAERRAGEWAQENAGAIAERNQRIRDRGVLSDYDPFRPRWLK